MEWTTDNLLFVSSGEELWAFSMPIEDFEDKKGFIFLSEILMDAAEEKQDFMIAHEIAHFRLNHKSPTLGRLSREETGKQEQEADNLAREWLKHIPAASQGPPDLNWK